jgi:YfiR/HmsC-like
MRPARIRARLGLAVLAAVLTHAAVAWPAVVQDSLEIAIKATDLYKFAAFVDWPPSAFAGPAEPTVLCIAGDDPFGPVLDQAVRGQRIGQRPIVVMRLDRVERGVACHVLFVAPSRKQTPADVLDKVRGQSVLTVTDAADGPARGMIDFVLKDSRVRFRVDPRAAERGGLMISSKLLGLAVKP